MNQYKPEGMLISTFENSELISSEKGLERALEKQIIIEAPATLCDQDFNLHVSLGGNIQGIIPRCEVQYPSCEEVKDIAILTRVGKPVCFKVIGFAKNSYGEKTAILSRRAAQKECYENYIATLMPGDIIPSKITHMESFGAFVDIGCGIISLLSIDSISVSRISHPSARLNVGDKIFTVVKSIDERGRIYGIVRSVESYGIFVELKPNLAGLAEYKDGVYVGQTAAVYIKSIIPEKMKIKLIIIDSHDAPIFSEPLKYFIDTEKVSHIDSWTYSPSSCKRVIETVF